MTTRQCPRFHSTALVLLHSTSEKICTDCRHTFAWPLDPGQKPVFKK